MRDLPVRLFARSLAASIAIVLLAGEAARAECTPAAADHVTATCTGTTFNEGGPGAGYGTGVETGVTVNVVSGATNTVTGTGSGIYLRDATVNNHAAASITGGQYGINANGFANVTNSGSITATNTNSSYGVLAGTNATVTNNAGASIEGGDHGIIAVTGFADVTNSGSITGTNIGGIAGNFQATVTNNAGASITGGQYGIIAITGFADVTNSGSITGTSRAGISARINATVTNNAGASIEGGDEGIIANGGFADVTNSGSITGTSGNGIFASTHATVTNNAGASITGGEYGIRADRGGSSVFNAGSISGGIAAIQFARTGNTLTLAQGSDITGNVLGTGSDTFQLGGTGAATFDAGLLGAQYQGFGTFNKIDSSVWTLTGTGTFAGPTNVNGGTLRAGAVNTFSSSSAHTVAAGAVLDLDGFDQTIGSLAGAGDVTLGAATLTTGGDNTSTTFSGALSGAGGLNKTGSGILFLAGTSSYSGPTSVNGGTLAVNGDISSTSGVTVNSGGTLGGNGFVGDTTINGGGALAPGNSIGLLTVRGNLVFAAASSYLVEVSPDNADRTNVTGTANLGGATVNAHFADGSYITRQYTILNATGGLGGSTFNALANTDLPDNFHTTLSYDNNNAYLNLILNFAVPSGLNGNQQGVANVLTGFFNSTGGIPLVFGALSPQGLTQVSGETAVGSQQATFDAMTQFMGVMTDPFIAGRDDGAAFGGQAAGYAEETALSYQRGRKPNDALAAIYTKAPPHAPSFERRWSVWAAGYGGSQTTDGSTTVGSNAATSRIFGTAVGADYRFSPFTLAGFALAGGGTNFSVANGGSGRSDLFQAGAFLRHTVGPAYISAALAYGWQDITTDRTITIAGVDQLRAKFNANAFSGRVEGGYRFVTPAMGITPYAAGQFTTFDLPFYAEQALSGADTFALSYGAKRVTASRSELGVRTDRSWAMTDAILTLRGRLAWAHDFNPDRNIAATFQTLPGASFVVNGAAMAPDAALTTASAEMKWLNGFSLAATFEGEFSDVTESYAGKGVVRYAW